MDIVKDIYQNKLIIRQLESTVSGGSFSDPAWEFSYFGHVKQENIFVVATYVSMNDSDGAGFWAFTVKEEVVSIKHMYFAQAEFTYWDAIAIAKLKYPSLTDIILD